MTITTNHITPIGVAMPGGATFPVYTRQWMADHLDGYFSYVFANPPYNLPAPLIPFAAPLFRNAFMAHFAGDEQITAGEQAQDDVLAQLSPLLGAVLSSAWTDQQPADGQLKITLPKH